MKLKQTVTAILVAGLLVASFAACENTQNRPDNTPGGSEDYNTTTTAPNGETPVPPTVVWTPVDETVYVTSAMTLVSVDNPADTSTVKTMDVLKRIKIGSNNQSVVVKNDKQYYAASRNLTSDDLEGHGFAPVDPARTVYTIGGVNVRTYASSQDYSAIKTTLPNNTAIKLVADGGEWYRVKYNETDYGFVFAKHISDEPVKDPDDLDNYPKVEDMAESKQYVIVEMVNLRKAPSKDATAPYVLIKGTEVTVVGSVVVDGKLWYKVYAPVEVPEGQVPVADGFISADCLDVNKDATSKRTLEEMLNEYREFVRVETAQILYATGCLTVRSTPAFPEKDSNYIDTLNKADSVKVVATGENEDVLWAMIEYKEGEYYFVSYRFLTTDSTGNEAAPTLDQLLATHSAFSACPEKTVYANGVVNCNTTPTNEDNVTRKLAKGDAVTVVATGTKYGIEWYIFETEDGKFFFSAAMMFVDTAPTA